MRRKGPLPDLEARERTAACRHQLLTLVREAVRREVLMRRDRIATAEPASDPGNAAGSISPLAKWEPLPCWTASRCKTNHARMTRVWRLRP